MWGYQPHDQPGSSHLNSSTRDICLQSQLTSSGEADETQVRNMAAEFCGRASIMLVGFFNMP
jgi:hypothetical protein